MSHQVLGIIALTAVVINVSESNTALVNCVKNHESILFCSHCLVCF